MPLPRFVITFSPGKLFSALTLSKWSLILINVAFIVTDIITSSIIWTHIATNYHQLQNETNLSDEAFETMVSNKKFGIVLTSTVLTTISTVGIVGALRKNINAILFYDSLVGLTLVLLLFGWRNYREIVSIYLTVVSALFASLALSLIYIKTIRHEPMRIRKQLLLNHVNNRESFIF